MELKEKNIKIIYEMLSNYFCKIYSKEYVERILGKIDDFKEKVETPFTKEEGKISLSFDPITIHFPSTFFEKLFYKCEINENSGILGYIELKNAIFIEYKELYTLNIKPPKQIPATRNIKFKGKNIDIFINPRRDKTYLDNEEFDGLYDYIIYTLKLRELPTPLTCSKEEYEISELINPISYLVKIDKDIEEIIPSLNYYLAKFLGIYPINNANSIKTVIFELEQDISKITENSLKKNEGTYAIDYYLKALNEPDPLYQFLDFYHVIETFCYNYIWEYYTKLEEEPKTKFEKIVKLQKEAEIISETLTILSEFHSNDFDRFKKRLDTLNEGRKNENGKLSKFLKTMNNNIKGEIKLYKNWDDNIYFRHFGYFIFKLRSEIAHRKIQKNPISKYICNYNDVIAEINKIMKAITEIIIEDMEFKD